MRTSRFLASFAALAALAAGVNARAEAGDLERARRQVRERQQDSLINLLRDADEQRRGIEESIARIDADMEKVEGQLAVLKPELDQATIDREHAAQAVTAAEGAFRLSRQTLGANALSMYATGQLPEMFTLINTADISDYVTAHVYIDTVVDSNSRVVDGFRRSAEQLRAQRALVELETKAILDRSQKLQAEHNRLASLKASKERISSDLSAAMAARTQALSAITNDPSGFDLIVRSYGSATEAIRILVAAAQKGQPVQQSDRGSVWWPAEGRISSRYGWRIHPIFKYRSFHTGIDIAADYGSKIRASAPGTVVDVVYLGAFGLVTVVDHGFSLATMYAHQARALVHPGERVQAGQVIGAVGCTGWCTGPHLHFEVWSRSNPQDPLRWLD